MDLFTRRLTLRRPIAGDLHPFTAMCADAHVMRHIGLGRPYDAVEARETFAAIRAAWDGGEGMRTAADRFSGEYLGFVGVVRAAGGDIAGRTEIGWRLKRSAWGRGLATEGALAVRDQAFTTLGLDRIVAICHPANHASARVMDKIGMRYAGRARDGRGIEVLLYELMAGG